MVEGWARVHGELMSGDIKVTVSAKECAFGPYFIVSRICTSAYICSTALREL